MPADKGSKSDRWDSRAESVRPGRHQNFVAERIVIETYTEIVCWIGESDPTTRRLIEDILKEEEDHADELNDLYQPTAPGSA